MTSGYSIDPSLSTEANLLAYNAEQQARLDVAPVQDDITDDLQIAQQHDVDNILRKKRKAREHKACYPCRQRKVKCDLSRPCQTCRTREHPELCNYNPPSKRQALDHPIFRNDDGPRVQSAGTVEISRSDLDLLFKRLTGLEQSIADLRRDLAGQNGTRAIDPALARVSNTASSIQLGENHVDVHGLHKYNAVGGTTHFGAGSIPAMLHALRYPDSDDAQTGLQEQLNQSIMPLFGLDGDATNYPFIDLWGLPHASLERARELVKVLPDDQQTLALLREYKALAYVMFPAVAHLKRFEQEVMDFLVNRAAQIDSPEAVGERAVHGQSFHWLGLLFAVLASGAQCSSNIPRKQRELTSQVYVCCAVECCRMTNFLARGTGETIQTLLVVQNVISNNMNAGTAWTMLGLTIRLAQAQGFHQPCAPEFPPMHTYKRSRVWWAIIWQDSMLSIVYDRAGSETLNCPRTMPMPMHYSNDATPFEQAMYKLASITHNIIRVRSCEPDIRGAALSTKIEDFHAAIMEVLRSSADYLQDVRQCQNTRQTLEYYSLYLHISYVLAELCRPALDAARGVEVHRTLCIQNLINTLEAYLGLQDVTPFARHSWPTIHRALSSALLLGILGQHNHNERARQLLQRFIQTVQEVTTSIDPLEVAAPLQRGIKALEKLDLSGQVKTTSTMLTPEMDGGARKKIEATFISPPQSNGDISDELPHAILNNILWGDNELTGTNAYLAW